MTLDPAPTAEKTLKETHMTQDVTYPRPRLPRSTPLIPRGGGSGRFGRRLRDFNKVLGHAFDPFTPGPLTRRLDPGSFSSLPPGSVPGSGVPPEWFCGGRGGTVDTPPSCNQTESPVPRSSVGSLFPHLFSVPVRPPLLAPDLSQDPSPLRPFPRRDPGGATSRRTSKSTNRTSNRSYEAGESMRTSKTRRGSSRGSQSGPNSGRETGSLRGCPGRVVGSGGVALHLPKPEDDDRRGGRADGRRTQTRPPELPEPPPRPDLP